MVSSVGTEVAWRSSRYGIGLSMLLVVVTIWVASSLMVKHIYQSNFHKPFFITYLNTSMFSMYLIGFAFSKEWSSQLPTGPEFRDFLREKIPFMSSAKATGDAENVYLLNGMGEKKLSDNKYDRLSVLDVIEMAFLFSIMWFSANYLFVLALANSKVSSVTVLSSTSGLFTLILETIWIGNAKDKLSVANILLVSVSMCGVGLVSYSDAQASPDASSKGLSQMLLGDFLALGSAFMYGCYIVFLQKKIGNEHRVDMAMFFGFVGVINTVCLWPLFIIFHVTGWETFEWPSTYIWGFLMVNAIVGTAFSDYLWLYSTLLTSPLTTTLGLSLNIPLAVLADALMHSVHFNTLFIAGTALVFSAFIGINLVTYRPINNWLVRYSSLLFGTTCSRLLFGPHEEEESVFA